MEYRLKQNWLSHLINVTIVGAGGTGGELIDNIARLHLTLVELGHPGLNVKIYDFDHVSPSNIGRTRYAPADIGKQKAPLIAQRYNLFYGLDFQGIDRKFEIAKEDVQDIDLLITCTDSAGTRVEIGEWFEQNPVEDELLWLDTGNGKDFGQVVLGHGFYDGLGLELPNVYKLYKAELEHERDNSVEKSSCGLLDALESQSPMVNKTISTYAGAMLFELFKDGVIDYHALYPNLENMTMKSLKINPNIWDFMMGKA